MLFSELVATFPDLESVNIVDEVLTEVKIHNLAQKDIGDAIRAVEHMSLQFESFKACVDGLCNIVRACTLIAACATLTVLPFPGYLLCL